MTVEPRRRLALVGATIVVLAALFVVRRPLMMSAPSCLGGRWHGCFDTFNGVLLMTLVGLPLALLAAWAMPQVRYEVGMVYGSVPFVWIALMPGSGAGVVPERVSLVPFRDLATMGALGIAGNLVMLAALTFFAPIRFAALASVPRILALGAGCSLLIEIAQFVFRLDRVSSVDDVLVNTTGAVLAGVLSRPWWSVRRERGPRARRGSPLRTGTSSE